MAKHYKNEITKKTKNTVVKNQSFLQGAMILSVSMLAVKLMGMLFKTLFANIVDPVGNGMFTIAYNVYEPLFMLATAGFPIAISRMVSESVAKKRYRDVRQLHSVSVPFLTLTGFICFIGMVFGGVLYAQAIESSESKYAIACLAPTILFGCLMSIYRGHFEGTRNMIPTAVSEIIEATIKLFVGLTLASVVYNNVSVEYVNQGTVLGNLPVSKEHAFQLINGYTVAAAMIGISLGAFLGFIYLLLRYKIKGDGITQEQLQNSPKAENKKSIFKRLALTALPIGINSIILSVANMVDSTMIQKRIINIMNTAPQELIDAYEGVLDSSLFLADAATGEFSIQTYLVGCFGYASTIMMIIVAVTQVFGTSALPAITTAWTSGDRKLIKRNIETVLRTTTFVTFPAGLGLCVLAEQIAPLIYFSSNVAEAMPITSSVLKVMGISVIFIATSTPICSMLQAVGRVDLPLKLMSVGMVMKIIINYILVGIPSINIQGAAVGSLVAYLFVCIVGIYLLCKETKIIPNFVTILIKPLVGSIMCAVAAFASFGLLNLVMNSKIATIIAILIAALVYFVVMILIKAINKDDARMLIKRK